MLNISNDIKQIIVFSYVQFVSYCKMVSPHNGDTRGEPSPPALPYRRH